MIRKTRFGLVSLALVAGILMHAFVGCYVSRAADRGVCEDDNNPCTEDSCDANGKPNHVPVADSSNVACFLGENDGVCRNGSCELNCIASMTQCKCSAKTDCPADTLCATWECTVGTCVSTAMMEGMTADPLQPGDCQKTVCQGGALKVVDDPADTPTDIKGDCQDPVCEAGVPKSMANDNDVPMTDMAGDCMKPACSGGVPGTTPDMPDIPAATACQVFACNADGTPQAANAPIGTKCGAVMDMACDKLGICVACLPAGKDDYDKCKMNSPAMVCPVKLCLGEGANSAGECQSKFLADGVCCDTTCTGECKGCTVPGAVGTCTNIPYYQTDPAYVDEFMAPAQCNSISRCNGVGACLNTVNTSCTLDAQCLSGKCFSAHCLGDLGEICNSNTDCASGVCVMGACK